MLTRMPRFAVLAAICLVMPAPLFAKRAYDWTWQLIADRATTVCMLRVDQVSEFAVWGTVSEEVKGCAKGQRLALKLESSSGAVPLVLPGSLALVAGFRVRHPSIFKYANIATHDLRSPLTWREWDAELVVPFEIAWSEVENDKSPRVSWHGSGWPTLQAALAAMRTFVRSDPAARELEVMRYYALSSIFNHLDMHPAQESWLSAMQSLNRLEDFLHLCISRSKLPSPDKDIRMATEGVIESLEWGGLETLKILDEQYRDDSWLQTTTGRRTVQILLQVKYPALTRSPSSSSDQQPPSVERLLAQLDPATVTRDHMGALKYAASVDFTRALAWLNAAGQFGNRASAIDAAYRCASIILHYIPATADRRSLLFQLTRHESVMVTVVAASLLMHEDMTEASAVLRAATSKTCPTSAALAALTLARWGSKEQVDVCLQKLLELSNAKDWSNVSVEIENRLILLLANSQRHRELDRRLIREIWLAGDGSTSKLNTWWSGVKSNAMIGDPLVFLLKKPAQ